MNDSIIFALYKNNEFQGWRQDTFGTIGKNWAKIYSYSKEQVEIVLKNIATNLTKESRIGKLLGSETIAQHEEQIHEKIKNLKGFEVRVVRGPEKIFETNFNVATAQYEEDKYPSYNQDEMKQVFSNPDDQEVIEVHNFALTGIINTN